MPDRHFLWEFFEPKSIAIIGVRGNTRPKDCSTPLVVTVCKSG